MTDENLKRARFKLTVPGSHPLFPVLAGKTRVTQRETLYAHLIIGQAICGELISTLGGLVVADEARLLALLGSRPTSFATRDIASIKLTININRTGPMAFLLDCDVHRRVQVVSWYAHAAWLRNWAVPPVRQFTPPAGQPKVELTPPPPAAPAPIHPSDAALGELGRAFEHQLTTTQFD
jgi:hypothetical protein